MGKGIERSALIWGMVIPGWAAMAGPLAAEMPVNLSLLCLVGGGAWSLAWGIDGYSARRAAKVPWGDISIRDAVDYLVNDSVMDCASVPVPPQPRGRTTIGLVGGHVATGADGPQLVALQLIEEQLGLGTLTAFGRRSIHPEDHALGFDGVRRKIPQDYWQYQRLRNLAARMPDTTERQTEGNTRQPPDKLYPYTDILINRAQIRAVWKPKWFRLPWRRIADPMLRNPTKALVVATERGQPRRDEGLRDTGERFIHEFAPGEHLSTWMRLAREHDAEQEKSEHPH